MNTYTSPPDPRDVENGKTVAILSYCTLIGFIIALVLNSSNKTRFGAYHLRQALGLFITAFALSIATFVTSIILPFLFFGMPVIMIGIVVLLILGLVNAINGKMEPVPLIGEFFNKLLSGLN